MSFLYTIFTLSRYQYENSVKYNCYLNFLELIKHIEKGLRKYYLKVFCYFSVLNILIIWYALKCFHSKFQYAIHNKILSIDGYCYAHWFLFPPCLFCFLQKTQTLLGRGYNIGHNLLPSIIWPGTHCN